MNASLQRLARRHLSAMLARFPSSDAVPRPRDGWVAAIREALGMTGRQFAARLGVSPSGVTHLEARERNDTITLAALRRAAAALNCDLVYAIVPRGAMKSARPEEMLDSMIAERAREIASAEIARVAHTMSLEGQETEFAERGALIEERVAVLREKPRRVWESEVTADATRARAARRIEPESATRT